MINWIKNLFKLTKPDVIHITCGEDDKYGFAVVYVNGEKTNIRLRKWDKEKVERLQKIGYAVQN